MADPTLTSTVEEMLENAAATGSGFYTGRQIVTFKPGAADAGVQHLTSRMSLRVASAAEFIAHAVDFAQMGDAGSLVFPELNIAVVSAPAAAQPSMMMMATAPEPDSPILAVEPETFVFPVAADWRSYLHGFAAATERITSDLGAMYERGPMRVPTPHEEAAAVAGSTWGLAAIRAV